MGRFSPKTYLIKTFGCQANLADSNTLAGILETLGYEPVASSVGEDLSDKLLTELLPKTDLFLVNTCSVRQKSEDKVYGLGKLLKTLSEENKKIPFIVLAGCMVGSVTGERQRYAMAKLVKRTPWACAYINPSQVYDLPNILAESGVLPQDALLRYDPSRVTSKQTDKKRAFVNISYGCDNFCTFCVVPYSRGAEVSRPKEEILTEINHLVARGITEITLCGQNVNSWGLSRSAKFKLRTGSNQKLPFAQLLRDVHALTEVTKIDFISSNPFDFTNDLIEALKLPKISNYIHIAVQSGNNTVLKNMNRRHTVEEFITLIAKIRQAKPKVEIGTDIIVGFPGETREQFMDTVRLLKTTRFNVAFISIYSVRKGTQADKLFRDNVPFKEKKWRHALATKAWKENPPVNR